MIDFFHYTKKKKNLFLNKQKSPKHSKEAVAILFLLGNFLFTSDLEAPITRVGREERERVGQINKVMRAAPLKSHGVNTTEHRLWFAVHGKI